MFIWFHRSNLASLWMIKTLLYLFLSSTIFAYLSLAFLCSLLCFSSNFKIETSCDTPLAERFDLCFIEHFLRELSFSMGCRQRYPILICQLRFIGFLRKALGATLIMV